MPRCRFAIESGGKLPSIARAVIWSWQVTQAIVPFLDHRLSQKNCLPSAIFSDVTGLSSGVLRRFFADRVED